MKSINNLKSILFFVSFIILFTTHPVSADNYISYNIATNETKIISTDNWETVTETPSFSGYKANNTRQIIDDCNLMMIDDPTLYTEYSSRVELITTYPNGESYRGSGTMIGPSTVLTAAHCVYNSERGGYANEIKVTPSRSLNVIPYGYSTSTTISIPSSYPSNSNQHQYDIAVINLSSSIGNVSGYLSCRSLSTSVLTDYYTVVDIFGYPGNNTVVQFPSISDETITIRKGELWGMSCAVTYANGKSIHHLGDTLGGMSGSGLVYMSQYVVGVHNRFPSSDTTKNYAARIDSEYLTWINGLII